jgi:drug/metabolite transporter (DMT)-like permease
VNQALSLPALLLPLGAGFGYACGAIAVKRSLSAGISGSWVNFFCNTAMALLFQIFWFFPGAGMTPRSLIAPATCGLLFFLGQFFTFRAIATGDVSVATPLLGAKVIFVAFFSFLIIGHPLSLYWWLASLLASVGIALISYSPGTLHQRLTATIAYSLGAASLFALTDVLVQRWVPQMGYSRFAPIMFGATAIWSCLYLPVLFKELRRESDLLEHKKPPCVGRLWLVAGALLLALQSLGMYSAIGIYGSATLTNILYGSRCLWSVVLVWIFGSLIGEAQLSRNRSLVMGCRFAGALLLFAAMALVLH